MLWCFSQRYIVLLLILLKKTPQKRNPLKKSLNLLPQSGVEGIGKPFANKVEDSNCKEYSKSGK